VEKEKRNGGRWKVEGEGTEKWWSTSRMGMEEK